MMPKIARSGALHLLRRAGSMAGRDRGAPTSTFFPFRTETSSRASSSSGSQSTDNEMVESLPVLPKPAVPPAPKHPMAPKGFFGKISDSLSFDKQQQKIYRGEALFQAASRQAADPRWYGPGRIGRAFRPRHAILTLHIWLLHKRLIADEYDHDIALSVDEELFNILWDDTTCRIRQAGVNELAVNKELMKVQQYTFLHLTHYDHAYTEYLDQPVERLNELRKIIGHHIFVRDPVVENRHDHLDRIAWYIDANYRNIMHEWPDEYYRESRVKWVDLPDFTNIVDEKGNVLPNQPIFADDVVPAPWVRNITRRGQDYYWNTETGESVYQKPTVATT